MSDSIIVILQGGLGNQLFQYVAGLAVKSHRKCDDIWLAVAQENKHSARDYRRALFTRGKSLGTDGVPEKSHLVIEQWNAFKDWGPQEFSAHASVALKGYYQYYPTIKPFIPVIRDDLIKVLYPVRETLIRKYDIRNVKDAYFLHVRRGDYLKQPANTLHLQDSSYYERAIRKIHGDVSPKARWFAISDDTAWCREQAWMTHLEVVEEPDEIFGLALMSLCEGGAIISNSTYAWWGAILGPDRVGSIIAYPKRWFADETVNLFPDGWIPIP